MSGNPLRQINNIYGYVRVSTDEQVKSGISLETQMQQIQDFVRQKYNREVDQFFADEGVSGTIPLLDRPASRNLTDVIDRHDVVICTRLDRFSRSTANLLGMMPVLKEIGITLYFCEQFGEMPVVYPDAAKSNGLDSKFDMNSMTHDIMVMVLSAVAEIESATIKDRFAAGKIDWASRGYAIGGSAPYGYRHVEETIGSKTRKFLEEVPEEQDVLKTIYKLKKRGLGARKIAKQVNSLHDIPPMTHSKVDRILKRKFQGIPNAA
jgi:putative DNA-invertase from lambdoid prophage Rac